MEFRFGKVLVLYNRGLLLYVGLYCACANVFYLFYKYKNHVGLTWEKVLRFCSERGPRPGAIRDRLLLCSLRTALGHLTVYFDRSIIVSCVFVVFLRFNRTRAGPGESGYSVTVCLSLAMNFRAPFVLDLNPSLNSLFSFISLHACTVSAPCLRPPVSVCHSPLSERAPKNPPIIFFLP